MIIFGTRGITTTAGQGEFQCPMCQSGRPFAHKKVRRVFTLYFVPVLPLDLVGEYVECGACRGTFKMAALQYNPMPQMQSYGQQAQADYAAAASAAAASQAQIEAEFHVAVRRIMVLMMLADGYIDPGEMVMVREVFQQITGRDISEGTLNMEIEAAQRDGLSMHRYLRSMLGYLNDHGKEMIVKAAVMVAASDGDYAAEEKKMLHEIGKGLQMPRSRIDQITTELLGYS